LWPGIDIAQQARPAATTEAGKACGTLLARNGRNHLTAKPRAAIALVGLRPKVSHFEQSQLGKKAIRC